MSAIDEVKQKTDIVEVIGQYVSLTKSGRNFRGLCPFHSEKHPSFYVYPEQGSWHCFGACATGGDAFSFIMKKENIDFGEALRRLAERAGVSLPTRPEPGAKRDEKERLYQINEAAAQYFHDLLLNSKAGEKARSYVAGRGLSADTVARFKLGFSLNSWEALKQHLTEIGYAEDELLAAGLIKEGEGGKLYDGFRNRLMFPICDLKGKVTGFGARALDDSMPKYLNSPQTPVFNKSHTLYGIDLATPTIREKDVTVITEGYMDVITAHQNGFSNVIASMGTAITEPQINILKRLSRNIILALDADQAGEEAMLRCVGYENTLDAEVKVITLPQGRDPDDVIREDPARWQRLLDEALPVIDYTFDMVTAGLDITRARDKTLATDRLLPVIAEIRNPIRQAHYLQKLARLVNVDERRLEAELARLKPAPGRYRDKTPLAKDAGQPPRILSSPVEDYCLALLLQYPELKRFQPQPAPEHFENSENREILTGWQKAGDLPALKASLDPALWEHLDYLLDYLKKREVPTGQVERRYADCVLNLRKKYLRGLEARRSDIFALEVELGGTGADLAKLEAEGIEPSAQLLEIFRQTRHKAKNQGAKE